LPLNGVKIATLKWLQTELVLLPTNSIAKADVHFRYVKFCEESGFRPVLAATLGKLLQTTFPNIELKRAGGRKKSEYYHMGICWKEDFKDQDYEKQDFGSTI
jgi:hypothetical protein